MNAESEDYQSLSTGLPAHALSEASKEELIANARLLQQTLAQFNIEVAIGDIAVGPSITCFEFHVAPGVRLQRIKQLSKNLMATLRADSIEVLAPIPGKDTVGIRVPNLFKLHVIPSDPPESPKLISPQPTSDNDPASGIDEDTIQQCIEIIRSEKKASVSLLQRRLRLGYGRAARIMDELENRSIVGPSKGAEPRDILINLETRQHDFSTKTESSPNTTEANITYTCPSCSKECAVAESMTGQNVICPNCGQEFYTSPIAVTVSQPNAMTGRTRYTLPAKLPFFRSGRRKLLAARIAELAIKGEFDEADQQELDCMAVELGLTQADIKKLQQEQMDKEFQPIKQRIQSVLMLTNEDEKAIRQLEKKYGSKLSLGSNFETLRSTYIMATTGRLPPPIQTGLMLNESEIVYHKTHTTWHQTRVNNYSFAGPSISIPIIKGVRYRIASYDVARTEAMTPLSSGVLYITSKRLLFVGESRNASIIISRIISLQLFTDALKVEKSTGKSDLFSMEAEEAVYITTMIGLIRL